LEGITGNLVWVFFYSGGKNIFVKISDAAEKT
jgi:hypothetical protein